MICDVAEFRGVELRDTIQLLYQQDMIDHWIAGPWEESRQFLFEGYRYSTKRELHTLQERYTYFPDTAMNGPADIQYPESPSFVSDSLQQPIRRSHPEVGRNDPCPCGSGRKYKKCCLNK